MLGISRSRSPPQKSMSQIKIHDNVRILTDVVTVRFVVLLPPQTIRNHKICLVTDSWHRHYS